jgi:hypothetical protein
VNEQCASSWSPTLLLSLREAPLPMLRAARGLKSEQMARKRHWDERVVE